MRRIEIPSAELQVSSYCLGTMYFGSKVPVDTSLTLLDAYADRGGNFLDSANKYASWIEGFSGGESEQVIGRWLKDRVTALWLLRKWASPTGTCRAVCAQT